MVHYVLLLKPEFGFARAMAIRANKVEERGDATVFLRDTRLVHQVPTVYVKGVERFDNQHDAKQHVKSVLEQRAGAATFHVQEYGVARPKKNAIRKPEGGFLAEAVVARIVEL